MRIPLLLLAAGCLQSRSSDPAACTCDDAAIQAAVDAALAAHGIGAGDQIALASGLDALGGEVSDAQAQLATMTEDLDDAQSQVTALSEASVEVLQPGDARLRIDVPPSDDCAGIVAAIASLDRYRLATGASATIQIADGTYTCADEIRFRHPDGGQIYIVGDEEHPENVVLRFSGDAITVAHGDLGYLGGMSLEGNPVGGNGLSVMNGGWLAIGKLSVTGFAGNGIRVVNGSFLTQNVAEATDWLTISNVGVGVGVAYNSGAILSGFQVNTATSSGVIVETSSSLYAPSASVSGAASYGYRVEGSSYAFLDDATATDCGTGFFVQDNSTMSALGAVSTNMSDVGFNAASGGILLAAESTSNGAQWDYAASGAAYLLATSLPPDTSSTFLQGLNATINAENSPGTITFGTTAAGFNDVTDFVIGIDP